MRKEGKTLAEEIESLRHRVEADQFDFTFSAAEGLKPIQKNPLIADLWSTLERTFEELEECRRRS